MLQLACSQQWWVGFSPSLDDDDGVPDFLLPTAFATRLECKCIGATSRKAIEQIQKTTQIRIICRPRT